MEFEHFWVKTSDGIKLSVNRYPENGNQILLIHGLASNSGLYLAMCENLHSMGYDTYSIDLRGHGMSDKPISGYDYLTISRDIASVFDHFKLKKPLLVGQSWGGNVVIDYISRYGENVLGGMLIDGGWICLKASFTSIKDAKTALAPPKFQNLTIRNLEKGFREMHPDWPKVSIKGSLMNFSIDDNGFVTPNLSFENHMRILENLYEDDPVLKAKRIKEPILLVVAGSKTPEKLEQVSNLEGSLKHYKTLWFENAVHDLHAQIPDTISELIKNEFENGIFTCKTLKD